MPNPRIMENYTPGVDDDPSSFTSYNVAEPVAPQPPASGAVPPPRQPDDQPSPYQPYSTTQPPPPPPPGAAGFGQPPPAAGADYYGPPPGAYTQPEPYKPLMPQPSHEEPGDVEYGSNPTPAGSVQTPLTDGQQQQGYPKPYQQDAGGYQGNGNGNSSSSKFKKWMIAAIVGILILVAVVVVVAVLALGGDGDDGGGGDDGTSREIKLAVPSTDELRRAVDAVLTGSGSPSVTATYGDIADWDVSAIEDFSSLFDANARNEAAATAELDLSRWNTSSGTDFAFMFNGATGFNSDISGWDTSRATDFSYAFAGATSFNQDIGGWNMNRVTTIQNMFAGATSFNRDISPWQLGSLQSMSSAFEGASSFSQPLCLWSDSLASSVAAAAAFAGTSCPAADRATDLAADPPGPLCFSCGTAAPTASPTVLVTSSAPTAPKLSFESTQELLQAVDIFLQDPLDGVLLDTYGPIGDWDVSRVTEFRILFDKDRNPLAAAFNEDISGCEWLVGRGLRT